MKLTEKQKGMLSLLSDEWKPLSHMDLRKAGGYKTVDMQCVLIGLELRGVIEVRENDNRSHYYDPRYEYRLVS